MVMWDYGKDTPSSCTSHKLHSSKRDNGMDPWKTEANRLFLSIKARRPSLMQTQTKFFQCDSQWFKSYLLLNLKILLLSQFPLRLPQISGVRSRTSLTRTEYFLGARPFGQLMRMTVKIQTSIKAGKCSHVPPNASVGNLNTLLLHKMITELRNS
jgi:hypothetical protein